MAENYFEAARRHYVDSNQLAKNNRWGNAAHLIGFAAECAIKHRISTLSPTNSTTHGHFPDLLATARKHLSSRRDTTLHAVLKKVDLMNGWNVNLRYEADVVVGAEEFKSWHADAKRLYAASGFTS